MKCRVKIYPDLNQFQQELVNKGHNVMWIAVDADQEAVFESTKQDEVIQYANEHKNVEYVANYVQL